MATKSKESTKKYIVIKPHTLGHEVGDSIELTDAKAKTLVGKVRLESDVAGEQPLGKADLKKLEKAEAKVEELTAKIAELEAKLAKKTDPEA